MMQEMMWFRDGSGIIWTVCKQSAPRSRQITTPTPRVQIAAATLSCNSVRQTVHTHRASVHQAAKLSAALLRIARLTAIIEYGLALLFSVTARAAVDAKKCHVTGRGVQQNGVRVGDSADFVVHTDGAGDGQLVVSIEAPGGTDQPVRVDKVLIFYFIHLFIIITPEGST